jgi:hypothetical protein
MSYDRSIMSFGDPCPNLSQAIDIAGDKYYLGTDRTVELGYKSRKDFRLAFGDNPDTMCLLRKYMPIGNNVLKTVFDSDDERVQLIQILKTRCDTIKASNQFNSSIFKNIVIQKNYIELQRIIEGLEGEAYKPREWGLKGKLGQLKGALPSAIKPTSVYKEYAKNLTDDQKIQLVLEMTWFLMHPELVPAKAQRRWFKMIKRLDTLRLDEFAGLSEKIQHLTQENPGKPLINYFKTLNLGNVIENDNIKYINSDKLNSIFVSKCDKDKQIIEERLLLILQLLKAKEYLSDDAINTIQSLEGDTSNIIEGLSESLVKNPGFVQNGGLQHRGYLQHGGAEEKEMSHGLRKSLVPFFDYFSGMYDPVYGVLDGILEKEKENKPSVDELVYLFNIMTKINPENDPKKYGIYRLDGINKSIVEFVRNLIKSTEFYTDKLSDSEKKEYFEDLEKLPQVRLSPIKSQINSNYKDSIKTQFISLMSIGAGITIHSEDEIEDPNKGFIRKSMDSHGVGSANKTLSSLNFGQLHSAITDFFVGDSLFIICNSEKNKLPLVLYTLDSNINLEDTVVNGTLIENYFNKLTIDNTPLYMDDLFTIDNENIVNEAVFALTIFISLKDLFNE